MIQLFSLLLCLCMAQEMRTTRAYSHLDYHTMRGQLKELQEIFPNVIKLETSEDLFGIGYDHEKVKCGSEKCMLDIVTVSDQSVSAD